ncbi:MAG TPA: PLP-dependent cysteine synthase family protein [Mycobacteriales bacterium]|nr:PLP-dependent cysteine synthase family protein [Mycobacteriales bacterium]
MSTGLRDVHRPSDRTWVDGAVRRLLDMAPRAADTPLLRLPLPYDDVQVLLKDESLHPTGSLKHRLAGSLVLYGLVNGWIRQGTTLVEASSGSTAVSEAWVARLLGLPFVAVLPRSTSPEKITLIEQQGGRCAFVDSASDVYAEATRLAVETGGHYLDQFRYAERATDWRGNNNIAESVFDELLGDGRPAPRWVVVGAGTGGTSATFGRYVRYRQLPTQVCVVDPEGSAFFDGWATGDSAVTATASRIEGIGRPRVEPSFLPGVVDRMIGVPDAASVAAARWLARRTSWSAGPSTGTNLVGALHLVAEMRAAGETGSVVTLLCDRGDRYADTCYDDAWVAEQRLDLAPWDGWLAERA